MEVKTFTIQDGMKDKIVTLNIIMKDDKVLKEEELKTLFEHINVNFVSDSGKTYTYNMGDYEKILKKNDKKDKNISFEQFFKDNYDKKCPNIPNVYFVCKDYMSETDRRPTLDELRDIIDPDQWKIYQKQDESYECKELVKDQTARIFLVQAMWDFPYFDKLTPEMLVFNLINGFNKCVIYNYNDTDDKIKILYDYSLYADILLNYSDSEICTLKQLITKAYDERHEKLNKKFSRTQ